MRQNTVVSDAFMNSADALIRKQDYLGLLAVCNRRNESVARITAKALDFATKNPTASFEEVREVTEAEGSRQCSMLLQRVSYLADIGAMSPLLGLLGTVVGLITSFNEIATGGFAGSQSMGVAKGVYEALFNTAAGLIVGIPSPDGVRRLPGQGAASHLGVGSRFHPPHGPSCRPVQARRPRRSRPWRP